MLHLLLDHCNYERTLDQKFEENEKLRSSHFGFSDGENLQIAHTDATEGEAVSTFLPHLK